MPDTRTPKLDTDQPPDRRIPPHQEARSPSPRGTARWCTRGSGGTFAPTPLSTRSQNGGTSEAHMSGNTPAHQNAGAPLAPQPGSTPNRSIIAISFRGCFGA
jgi:hypothetical protein